MKKLVLLIAAAGLMGSCAGEFESEAGLAAIASQGEFGQPLYAPLHLGREVLTGVNHTNPEAYIRSKFAVLLDADMIRYDIAEKNSWRTLVHLSLTDKAASLVDEARTDKFQKEQGEDDLYYVAVCHLAPETISRVDTISADTMRVHYSIVERDITPFGTFLGFRDGRTHLHNRDFVKSTFSWTLSAPSVAPTPRVAPATR